MQRLVFAADSRLSGGARTFDYCAKILTLPRSDCAIAFAGFTDNAYPMMHQLSLAIDSFGPLRDRFMDIREVKTHAIKIFDSMASSITNESPHLGPPDDFTFLLGGYSWIEKRFFIWTIRYSVAVKRFIAVEAPTLACNGVARKVFFAGGQRVIESKSNELGQIAFAGDQGPEGSRRLIRMLTDRFSATPSLFNSAALDFEPFEVVCQMLKDPQRAHSIGGAPQLVKVYEHLNTQSFAVKWGASGEGAFLQGRPLLSYENVDVWIMDPVTCEPFVRHRLRVESTIHSESSSIASSWPFSKSASLSPSRNSVRATRSALCEGWDGIEGRVTSRNGGDVAHDPR